MLMLAFLLIFTGPWLVYLFTPVPDQLAEYRNYSMCAGFALLTTALPDNLWTPLLWVILMIYGVGMSHAHALAWTDQITFWKVALEKASGDRSRATQEIGAFLKISGKNDEAEPYFIRALELNPNLAPAMENLASVYFVTNRRDQGIATIDILTNRCPQYQNGWQIRGLLYEQEGKLKEARECLERACALYENVPQSANHLGLISYREGKFEEALTWFERARKYHPEQPELIYNTAQTYAAMGNMEEAMKWGEKIRGVPLQISPEIIPPQLEAKAC